MCRRNYTDVGNSAQTNKWMVLYIKERILYTYMQTKPTIKLNTRKQDEKCIPLTKNKKKTCNAEVKDRTLSLLGTGTNKFVAGLKVT